MHNWYINGSSLWIHIFLLLNFGKDLKTAVKLNNNLGDTAGEYPF